MNKKHFVIGFISVLFLDQFSKFLAEYLDLEVVINTGVSFNFLSSLPSIFTTIILIIFVVGVYLLFSKDWDKHPIISGIFFGGAVSNIIDRLIVGGVRDWIPFPVLNVSNNIADIAIFIGLALFIFSELKDKKTTRV